MSVRPFQLRLAVRRCCPLVKPADARYDLFSSAPAALVLPASMHHSQTLYLARHAETVFNRAARMQGNDAHTPLTANGLQQALAMAEQLKAVLGEAPDLQFWCSPAGRTRQTAAAIADALGLDYFDIRMDERLKEIEVGDWTGRRYADITAQQGPIVDPNRQVFIQRPPRGEWYDDVAQRMQSWLNEVARHPAQTHLAISHGIASRVLRGLLDGASAQADLNAALAPSVPQGHIVVRTREGEEVLAPGGPSSQSWTV